MMYSQSGNKEIFFYHAVITDTYQVLFELLKKSFNNHKKSLVCCSTMHLAAEISDYLYQAQEDFIVPHGIVTEAYPEQQPILLAIDTENINQADYIFFIGDVEIQNFDHFERIIVIFDNQSESIKDKVREQWQFLKQRDYQVTYYKQSEGGWQKI